LNSSAIARINKPGKFNAKDAAIESVSKAQNAKSRFVDDQVRGSRYDLLGMGNLRTRPLEETKKTLPAVGRDSRLAAVGLDGEGIVVKDIDIGNDY
jgi:hypothetical protein